MPFKTFEFAFCDLNYMETTERSSPLNKGSFSIYGGQIFTISITISITKSIAIIANNHILVAAEYLFSASKYT